MKKQLRRVIRNGCQLWPPSFLYLFPIILSAGFLPRWMIVLLGVACAVLSEMFSSLDPSGALIRLAFETLALHFVADSAGWNQKEPVPQVYALQWLLGRFGSKVEPQAGSIRVRLRDLRIVNLEAKFGSRRYILCNAVIAENVIDVRPFS